jgi:2,4-diaminopentanoate dehydrogenase
MTGDVGQVGVRHFAENPVFDLVGVLVHSKEKVGSDAGDIAGIPPVGVAATDDIEAIVAMDADCVFYTPIIMDTDTVCRLLRSGKNVVTTSGFFYPSPDFAADGAKIRTACEEGGTSFHAGGIHPGYAVDILPMTLARVMSRIDKIVLYEVVNVLTDAPLDHIDWMGFGKQKDKFLSEPTILGLGVPFFAQSMYMIADGLGLTIDEVTAADVKAAVATEDIPHELGAVPCGTVAAQHHEWTAWVGGRPLIVFHAIYLTSSPEKIEPAWDWGKTRYRIVVEGDPPTELTL